MLSWWTYCTGLFCACLYAYMAVFQQRNSCTGIYVTHCTVTFTLLTQNRLSIKAMLLPLIFMYDSRHMQVSCHASCSYIYAVTMEKTTCPKSVLFLFYQIVFVQCSHVEFCVVFYFPGLKNNFDFIFAGQSLLCGLRECGDDCFFQFVRSPPEVPRLSIPDDPMLLLCRSRTLLRARGIWKRERERGLRGWERLKREE